MPVEGRLVAKRTIGGVRHSGSIASVQGVSKMEFGVVSDGMWDDLREFEEGESAGEQVAR